MAMEKAFQIESIRTESESSHDQTSPTPIRTESESSRDRTSPTPIRTESGSGHDQTSPSSIRTESESSHDRTSPTPIRTESGSGRDQSTPSLIRTESGSGRDQSTPNKFRTESGARRDFRLEKEYELYDNHSHIDLVMARMRKDIYSLRPLSEIEKNLNPKIIDNYKLGKVVHCVKDPRCFETTNLVKIEKMLDQDDRVYLAVGIHPKSCLSYKKPNHETNFLKLVAHKKCVAIGECGFDLSDRCLGSVESQKIIFEKQIMLAQQTKKPLILHLRDLDEKTYLLTKNLLKKHLPSSHKIYLHCASKCRFKEVLILISDFPNLYLGLNPGTMREDQLVRTVREDRFLLETDAPFFCPTGVSSQGQFTFSVPHFVYFSAEEFALKRGSSVRFAVKQNAQNSNNFFSFEETNQKRSETTVYESNVSIYCTDVPSWFVKKKLLIKVHFEKFGEVTEIQTYSESNSVLVTFAKGQAAERAAESGSSISENSKIGGIHVLKKNDLDDVTTRLSLCKI
jgi:TatD DNase family protein